ncbi:PfkB family carbohydrate kinase [Pseudonocardia kujensis]|nr:PfkB family carbohydrate kinase [Pseudonocardia kujensis]
MEVPVVPEVVVVGQLARDLVLVVDALPDPGAAADVRERREMLGGKGANCAVGVAQLGATVALVAVAGDDPAADLVLDRARQDGLDVSRVVRRHGAATGLVVDVLERDGSWRYLQDLDEPVLVTPEDVDAAAAELRTARAVVLQGQQPASALLTAARHAHAGGARLLLDGVPGEDGRDALLGQVDVLRADPAEAAQLVGREIDGPRAAIEAGRTMVDDGLGMVVLGVERGEPGNVAVWSDGDAFLPLEDGPRRRHDRRRRRTHRRSHGRTAARPVRRPRHRAAGGRGRRGGHGRSPWRPPQPLPRRPRTRRDAALTRRAPWVIDPSGTGGLFEEPSRTADNDHSGVISASGTGVLFEVPSCTARSDHELVTSASATGGLFEEPSGDARSDHDRKSMISTSATEASAEKLSRTARSGHERDSMIGTSVTGARFQESSGTAGSDHELVINASWTGVSAESPSRTARNDHERGSMIGASGTGVSAGNPPTPLVAIMSESMISASVIGESVERLSRTARSDRERESMIGASVTGALVTGPSRAARSDHELMINASITGPLVESLSRIARRDHERESMIGTSVTGARFQESSGTAGSDHELMINASWTGVSAESPSRTTRNDHERESMIGASGAGASAESPPVPLVASMSESMISASVIGELVERLSRIARRDHERESMIGASVTGGLVERLSRTARSDFELMINASGTGVSAEKPSRTARNDHERRDHDLRECHRSVGHGTLPYRSLRS